LRRRTGLGRPPSRREDRLGPGRGPVRGRLPGRRPSEADRRPRRRRALAVPPTVAVIGAGNVGCALAADLVLRGVEVRLCNRSPARLEPIRRAGGITATGALEGFAPLDRLTDSVEDAVRGADVVAVTVPTPALPHYAPALVEVTTTDQLIWLDPGHSGGALYLAAEMDRRT